MRVRLTRKFAEQIDGVDLSAHNVGDALELSPLQGRLLIAEQWAILERRTVDRGEYSRQRMPGSADVEPNRPPSSGSVNSSKSHRKSLT
jgi:hypothetical protein